MSKSQTKIWIIVATVVLIIGVGTIYNRNWVEAYYYNLKQNHHRYGDQMLLNGRYMRIAKSALYDEVIPIWRIAKSDKGYDFVRSPKAILNKNLVKYKVSSVGTYIDWKLIPFTDSDGKTGYVLLYAFKPDDRLLGQDNKASVLKPGYKYINEDSYISLLGCFK
ncbi:MAG TPA: hypothetical protein VIQ77_05840 [Mucilaginibacter sp.]